MEPVKSHPIDITTLLDVLERHSDTLDIVEKSLDEILNTISKQSLPFDYNQLSRTAKFVGSILEDRNIAYECFIYLKSVKVLRKCIIASYHVPAESSSELQKISFPFGIPVDALVDTIWILIWRFVSTEEMMDECVQTLKVLSQPEKSLFCKLAPARGIYRMIFAVNDTLDIFSRIDISREHRFRDEIIIFFLATSITTCTPSTSMV